MSKAKKIVNRLACALLVAALVVGASAAVPGAQSFLGARADAANPTPYPWSPRAATLDYIDDVYDGISGPSVFEDVTAERLLDILSSAGDYYILFGGPQNASTQKIIGDIASEAGEAPGITKIYHFNPLLDGYQLDITKTDGVGLWAGGHRGDMKLEKLHDVWTDIVGLLPPGVDSEVADYDSDDTLLFRFHKNARTDLPAQTSVPATYTFYAEDVDWYDEGDDADSIADVFGPPSSVRSDYDFFKRVYNGNATFFNLNGGRGATANRTGKAEAIISDSVFGASGAGFTLHQVTPQELFNVLNAPGEHAILFASAPCHNTQAIVGEVAKRAKANGFNGKVYVYDPALGGATIWGTGAQIDTVKSSASTGGLYTRNSNYNFSYIYANIVSYFKQFVTENYTKRESRIDYYPNGDISRPKVAADPWSGAAQKSAIRLQVPFLLGYDKSKAAPVVKRWIHQKNGLSTYSEYMLDLTFVQGTALARALPVEDGKAGNDSVDTDGLQAVEFAAEAVRSLDNVLKPGLAAPVVHSFTRAPSPKIAGSAAVGRKLTAAAGALSQAPSVSYQWYVGGKAVKGASSSAYKVKKSDLGKKIKVAVTISRTGYKSVTAASAQTAKVAKAFAKYPAPKIKGTAKVGKTLKAAIGKWSPKPTKFQYQWYADGKKIGGATKSSLKLKKAQKGKRITVQATPVKKGYEKYSVVSKATKKVK
ncbi:MAG: hypothetical protein LBG50_00265 [Clostridiales Family XIII bacterium]|jgi:hypothetical protein|nr:hypothetical protein [Clostridiales Family XIII bacterium]